jgi:integrase
MKRLAAAGGWPTRRLALPRPSPHVRAALLIANGRHMEEVKGHLGHSSIRVTSDRYGHLFPQARQELADSLEEKYRNAASAGGADVRPLRP